MRVIKGDLPHGVFWEGIYYPIKTDFRVWLSVSELLETKDMAHASERAPDLCYIKKRPASPKGAFLALMDFYLAGEKPKKETKNTERLFSFSEDEELIYASFLKEYGIDLAKEEMHWWRFVALLRSLGPDTALSKVMSIRMAKPSDIKNPKERRHLLRQKRLFALSKKDVDAGDVLAELFNYEEVR